jgi:hypothetical protein
MNPVLSNTALVSTATVATIPVGGDPVTGAITSIISLIVMKLLGKAWDKWFGGPKA